MERLSFNETYNIEDRMTPKGVVVIRDKDGNILYKGHNMVVKTGRELLFKLFLNSGSIKFSNLNAFIGSNTYMTALNDEYDSNKYTSITDPNTSPIEITTIPSTCYSNSNSNGSGKIYKNVEETNSDDFMIYCTPSEESSITGFADGTDYYVIGSYVKADEFVSGTTYYTKTGDVYTYAGEINAFAPDTDYYIIGSYAKADEFVSGTTYYVINRIYNNSETLYYRIDNERLYIHMGINYEPNETIAASTFGLYFEEGGTKKLFSRIVFPERTLTSHTPLIIDYYLYF